MKLLYLILTTFLYAYAGADKTSKNWRRIGIPLVVSVYLCNLLGLLLYIPLSMGYGESSWLRKLLKSNISTRLIISTFMSVIFCFLKWSLIPLLFIPWYLLWTVFCRIDDRLIFGLNVEELLIGLGIGISVIL